MGATTASDAVAAENVLAARWDTALEAISNAANDISGGGCLPAPEYWA